VRSWCDDVCRIVCDARGTKQLACSACQP
jgi:hypothetical protein